MSDERRDEPFRSAEARPRALVALGARGPAVRAAESSALVTLLDASEMRDHDHRVAAALDVTHYCQNGVERVLAYGVIGGGIVATLIAVAINAWHQYEIAMGSIVAVMVGVGMLRANPAPAARGEGQRRLTADVSLPFPVDGYEAWLAGERHRIDVHLRGAVDREVFAAAARAIDALIEVEWLDARVVRLAPPPRRVRGALVGDRELWLRLSEEILVPLHQAVGVDRVELSTARRALAAPAR